MAAALFASPPRPGSAEPGACQLGRIRVHGSCLRRRRSWRPCASLGLDLSDHRSRLVTPALLDGADLVIGMARQHVIDLALLAPDAWERCFTLADVLRRARVSWAAAAFRERPGLGAGAWEASDACQSADPPLVRGRSRIRWAGGLGITTRARDDLASHDGPAGCRSWRPSLTGAAPGGQQSVPHDRVRLPSDRPAGVPRQPAFRRSGRVHPLPVP